VKKAIPIVIGLVLAMVARKAKQPEGTQQLKQLNSNEERRFTLPAASGSLHLYSLGHARLVDSAALPDAG
jgi:hypothetical protein